MKVSPLVLGLLLAACSASTPAGDVPAKTTSRDLLTADEIKTIDAQTAYDAIKRLRPRFLTPGQNRTPPVVYINGRKTDLRELTTLRAEEIMEVRYYEPGEATTRYGTGHLGGALEIKLGTARPY